MRIVVTGASGFVGQSLVEALARDGHEVVATYRRAPAVAPPASVRVVTGLDLAEASDWRAPMRGAEAVVHLATLAHEVHAQSPPEVYERVNVGGTRAILAAATAEGVRRFVHMSTAKVMGEGVVGPMEPYRERDDPRPEGPYGTTKLAAEGIVRAAPLQTTILRPPVVYGPHLKANMLRLFRAIDAGRPLPVGGIRNIRSLIAIDNLLDAVRVALTHPKAAGRTYFVADAEAVSTPELARRIGTALGRPSRIVPVPQVALRAAGRIFRRQADIDRLLSSLVVDSTSIGHELGWRAPLTLDEGLSRAAAWYRASADTPASR